MSLQTTRLCLSQCVGIVPTATPSTYHMVVGTVSWSEGTWCSVNRGPRWSRRVLIRDCCGDQPDAGNRIVMPGSHSRHDYVHIRLLLHMPQCDRLKLLTLVFLARSIMTLHCACYFASFQAHVSLTTASGVETPQVARWKFGRYVPDMPPAQKSSRMPCGFIEHALSSRTGLAGRV